MPTSGHLARGTRLPLAIFVALIALLSLGATSALAAGSVTSGGGTTTYTGDGGANNLVVSDVAPNYNYNEPGITAGAGCVQVDANNATCPKTTSITINLLAGADSTTFAAVGDNDGAITVTQNGGPGTDTLRGTQGSTLISNGEGDADTLNSLTAGNGTATLDGGAGDDTLNSANEAVSFATTTMINSDGADTFTPTAEYEIVTYESTPGPVTVTLDGAANDGRAGENDNVGLVDLVRGSGGNDTLTGSEGNDGGFDEDVFFRALGTRGFGPGSRGLAGGAGNDTVNGLGGGDFLTGDAGDDTVNGGDGRDVMDGGAGNDNVTGGNGTDSLSGGEGNDSLDGGAGNDSLFGGPGADNLVGGADFDNASVEARDPGTGDPRDVTVTLDDQPNDHDGDNFRSDIEDLDVFGGGRATITGSGAFNVIDGGDNGDTIDGAAGSDLIRSGEGDDTVNARDGLNDRIDCGPGIDTANVDQFDEVTNCERVNRENVAAANADRNPTVSFAGPASNAVLPANTPTRVTVNASDDRGVSRVILFDEDRVVGTDTAAPYEFSYQATGDDVGKNTLAAVAVDTSEQATNAIRNVRVNRFRPSIRGVIRPARDRTAPFRFRVTGGITLPRTVTRAQACRTGFVSVQVKRRTRTISTRRVKIKRTCGFSSSVTFRNTRRLGNGRLKVTVRFLGNAVLAPRTARSVNVRAG